MDDAANVLEFARTWWDIAIPLSTSIVAIIAILWTSRTAMRQVRATSVSVSRRQRMDSLRDDLAKVMALHGACLLRGTTTDNERRDFAIELLTLSYRIELLLSPNNSSHAALLVAIDKYRGTASELSSHSPESIHLAVEKVIATGRAVIDEEWSRIKLGR